VSTEGKVSESTACVVFDGQCPFCRAYVASLENKDENNHPGLNKVDARSAPELVGQLADKDVDINAGIVVIKGDGVLQDAEALTLLAREHGASGWLAGLHHRLLRYRLLSLAIYPILRTLRNAYLRLAGQSAIQTGIDKG
jgi:predicted DCC family thiol-disulfide oxidoreductase YuxK